MSVWHSVILEERPRPTFFRFWNGHYWDVCEIKSHQIVEIDPKALQQYIANPSFWVMRDA